MRINSGEDYMSKAAMEKTGVGLCSSLSNRLADASVVST